MDTDWVYGVNGNSLGSDSLRIIVSFGLVYQELDKLVAMVLEFSSDMENNHN